MIIEQTEREIWVEKALAEIANKTLAFSPREKLSTKIRYLEKVLEKIPTMELSDEDWEEFTNKSDKVLAKLPQKVDGQTLICRDYLKALSDFRNYVRQNFKLVPRGFYLRIFLVLGIILGLVFGALSGQIAIGALLGIGLGLIIGSFLDKKSTSQNKVL